MDFVHQKTGFMGLRMRLVLMLVAWTSPVYVYLFKNKKSAWMLDVSMLCDYPEQSLGKALGIFLLEKRLSLIPHLEDHDVMHVLLGYDTTVRDEIRMQFFLLGSGKRSLYAVGTSLIGFILLPEHWGAYLKAYRRGCTCINFSCWNFLYLLNEPVETLRAQIFQKQNLTPPFVL